ncbi:hypothetical protein [Marisediminicola senii]|uniref:hypothetical protein n=1 Tax=Marisediminicola senii TaxID=2711233 RepID=UPI0013EA4E3C|nr:hypothetical protein [Marisediminicola senii]
MVPSAARTPSRPPQRPASRATGIGRVLVFVYGILALAATGRSVFQIGTKFGEAPVAYALSALAAVVYIVATIALVAPGARWYRVAVVTIAFELVGVLVVGVLSIFDPVLFPDDTVWSFFGRGYLFIPLIIPVLGLLWLRRTSPHRAGAEATGPRPDDTASGRG